MGELRGRVGIADGGGKEIVIAAAVALSGNVEGFGNLRALIDTGATHCAIDREIAGQLDLQPEGHGYVETVSGKKREWVYYLDLRIPLTDGGDVELSGVKFFSFSHHSVDMIIGMDVICRGALHVSGDDFTFALQD